MITPLNVILVIIWGILVPFCMGFFAKIIMGKQDKISIAENISYGFAIMCAFFQLLAVPMIFAHVKFHVLQISWMVLIVITIAFSLTYIFMKQRFKFEYVLADLFKAIKNNKFTLLVWIFAILVIAFETYLLTFKMHMDTDDSRFLADALEAVEQDTMLLVHPITGKFYNVPVGEQLKDVTSPYPIFLGLIGNLFKMSPTIAAHTFLPLLFIPLSYLVFSMIGNTIFNGDAKKQGLFILFLSLIHLFSFETVFSAGYTLLTIVWQGRSVVALIMLPLLWSLLLKCADKESIKVCDYILLLIISIAASMLSNMGSLFSAIMIFSYALVIMVKKRSVKTFVLMCMCCIPAAIYVVLEKLLVSYALLY